LKQLKIGEDLYDFLAQLQKHGLEKMLEDEFDAYLGYDKHEKTNARNGFSNKKIKTSFVESEIQVPRDRDASLYPPNCSQKAKYDRRFRKRDYLALCQRDEQ
jgi:putative transposase